MRQFYYNDIWKCVEERLNAATTPDRLYYWGTRPGHRDELLRRDRATAPGGSLNETLWCLMDYFDPIAVTDGSGTVQERYSYSAFGLATFLTPSFSSRSTSSFSWNFLFHGQFRDPETNWDNYGYRYYLPWLGRWPSRDPIGLAGGLNLYGVVGNALVQSVDRLGLAECNKGEAKIGAQKNLELNAAGAGSLNLDAATEKMLWDAIGLAETLGNLGPTLTGNAADIAAGLAQQGSGSMTDLGQQAAELRKKKLKEAEAALKNAGFEWFFWTGQQEYQCCVCLDGKTWKWGDKMTKGISSKNFLGLKDVFLSLAEAIADAQNEAKKACGGR